MTGKAQSTQKRLHSRYREVEELLKQKGHVIYIVEPFIQKAIDDASVPTYSTINAVPDNADIIVYCDSEFAEQAIEEATNSGIKTVFPAYAELRPKITARSRASGIEFIESISVQHAYRWLFE